MKIPATRVVDEAGNIFEFESNGFGSVSVVVSRKVLSAQDQVFDAAADSFHPTEKEVVVGTPIRFKVSGTRVAADFPGVDSNFFNTDAEGHIANG